TWLAQEIAIFSGPGAGGGVDRLSLQGVASDPPLSKEQQRSAEHALRLNNQAVSLFQRGRYREAIANAREAVKLRQEAFGPEHPATATSLSNLGFLLRAHGEYAAARPYHEEALAILKKVLGPDHPYTATS